MKILNADGSPYELEKHEIKQAKYWERKIKNALGYEIDITTLTTIVKKVSEQKFYNVPFADYVPVIVGQGAWSSNLTTYLSYDVGGDFEGGNINTGGQNGRLAEADAAVDSLNIKVINWAKAIGWSIFDLQLAAKSGNWDLVSAKEKARKRNWDLGLQAVAFLGSKTNAAVKGLLTQTGVTVNTTLITKAISSMTPDELKTFVRSILGVYRTNCNFSAWPTHFEIPETDYNGLASPSSASFPIKSAIAVLRETFIEITMNKGFQILPSAYGEASINTAYGVNKQRYALYNYEEESLAMNIPVDYTATLANSLDNFMFQNAAYGQYTGVLALRPKEMIYFDY